MVGELCRLGADSLSGTETPILDAQLLLCYVLGCERMDIVTRPEKTVSEEQKRKYISLIEKRASGVPLEYIIGQKEFMSLPFLVNRNVLIPRPDTETLVERVIKNIKSGRILEIGTGSGCIAVSLAKYIPDAIIDAIDISEEALVVARKNAEINGISVNFIRQDIMENFCNSDGIKYDAVVSNPPYIESDEIIKLMPEVQNEPKIALDGGTDGLDFYKRIISLPLLRAGGYMAFEVGHKQAEAVIGIMNENGFEKTSAWKDLPGILRVVDGFKCSI